MEKFVNITKNQIKQKGVQALADRPNLVQQYGVGGLSAMQLKLHFDKLADFLADKINEIHGALSSDKAADYIRVALDEYEIECLGDLVKALSDGTFASVLPLVRLTVDAEKQLPLQDALYENSMEHEALREKIESLGYGYTGAYASIEDDGGEFGVDLQIKNLSEDEKELHFYFKNIVKAVLDKLPTYGGETT